MVRTTVMALMPLMTFFVLSSWICDETRCGRLDSGMTEKIVQGILDRFGTKNLNPNP
jgi:hypothetical protein